MSLNLIQIQNRLKDLPEPIIQQYVNGMNPEVPPYLALGEMERRKRIHAEQATQQPQGTVKERLEREVMSRGIAQLQTDQAKQAQGMQQMTQSAGQQSPQVPEGAPQPVQAAQGGVLSLPVRDYNFAPGGIVSFKKGETVEADYSGDPMGTGASEITSQELKEDDGRNIIERLLNVDPDPQWKRDLRKPKPQVVEPKPERTEINREVPPPAVNRVPVQRATTSQSQGGGEDFMKIASQFLKEQPVVPKSGAEMIEEAAKTNPLLGSGAYDKMSKFLEDRAAADKAAGEQFKRDEQARARQDLFKSMIAAGQPTGVRGIGGIAASLGSSLISSNEAAAERANKQRALEREQEMNMAKLQFELTSAQRAEARGDLNAKAEHLMKAEQIKQQMRTSQMSLVGNLAQTQAYSKAQAASIASANKNPYEPIIKMINDDRVARNLKPLSGIEALQAAVPFTSAGVGAGARSNAALEEQIRDIRKRYEPMIMTAANDAEKKKYRDMMNEAISNVGGGSGGVNSPTPVTSGKYTVTKE